MSKNELPTPDATGRERMSGNIGIRAVQSTLHHREIPRRDRAPKEVRGADAIGRPLASGLQILALRRPVTAATVVTNPKEDSFKYCLIYYFDNISVFRFIYRPKGF